MGTPSTPEFWHYQMPQNKYLSAIEAFQKSRAATELYRTSAQKREQSQQMFPLKMQGAEADIGHTNALIEQINADASLTPQRRTLLISQAMEASSLAKLHSTQAEKEKEDKYQSQAGKILADAKKTTDPQERAQLMAAFQAATLGPEEKQAEVMRAKDWSKMAMQDNDMASGANKTLQALKAFNSSADRVPAKYKGAFYIPENSKLPFSDTARRFATASGAGYGAAEKFQSQLQLAQQALVKSGARMNINLLNTLNRSTVGLGLSDEARKEVTDSLEMGARLTQEKVKFNSAARKAGINDPQVVDEIWSTFNNNYPVISEDNKPIRDNLEKWKDVLDEYKGGAEQEGAKTVPPLNEQTISKYMKKYPGKSREDIIQAYQRTHG